MTHNVFCYGTLRLSRVQEKLFGRPVETIPDALPGWKLDWLKITDPEVVALSGLELHPVVRESAADHVEGACLIVTDDELAAIDAYEVADYARVEVRLASGVTAWTYVAA